MRTALLAGSLALVFASAGCGSTTPEPTTTHAGGVATASPPAASASAAPAAPPKAEPPPIATRALAGADTCKVALHPLDAAFAFPSLTTEVVVGFGEKGGLAAFLAPHRGLSLKPLDAGGKPSGATVPVAIPEKFAPKHVVGIDGGFLVIGDLYEFSHMRAAAVATDESGKPLGTVTELDLEHRFIHDVAPAQGREVVILATRALMVPDDKDSLRGKWLSIKVAPDGKLEQKAADLPMAYPLIRAVDVEYPLQLEDKPAWYIRRGGDPKGELIRDAKLESISPEELTKRGITKEQLNPPDEVDWAISFEPAGAEFQRMHAGKNLGNAVMLPPGISVTVLPTWNGAAWVFGYSTQLGKATTVSLAVVDCR